MAAHIRYEEEQRFSKLGRLWFTVFAVLMLMIWAVLSDENKPDAFDLLLMGGGFIPVFVLLIVSKLQIRIDTQGFHYRFIPKVLRWRSIEKGMIDSFEIRSRDTLLEKISCGYHRSLIKNTIMMNISGKKFVTIKLKSGRRLKIGSENPETMVWALKRLTNSIEE